MKTTIRKNFFLLTLVSGAALTGCDEQSVTSDSSLTEVKIDSTKSTIVNISGQIFSVPSPIQTAILIKNTGSSYERDSLNSTDKIASYTSKSLMALNLGVYGTDMAYASLYEDPQTSLQYFKAVEDVSESLEIKGAIDVSLLKRIGSNVGNADSLMLISSKFYQEADNYLKENERLDIAAMVLTGGWIESTYLTTLAISEGNEDAKTRLAEQKNTAKTICDLLRSTCDERMLESDIMKALDGLNSSFSQLETSYTYSAPETNSESKTTIVKSASTYNVNDEQIADISTRINAIRELIIL